jgi:alanine racemase
MHHKLTWIEISSANLRHNVQALKKIAGPESLMCPAVKGNAYGHGLTECAPVILEAGAEWLGVNALFEALALKESGISAPIYIMGYVPFEDLEDVVRNGFRMVVYNGETLARLAEITKKTGKPALTHLKLETGNWRQGVSREELNGIAAIYKANPLLKLEGASTHFANIEDTTDRTYANYQLNNFKEMVGILRGKGLDPEYLHCANTASTILYPDTYFNMVRTGIGIYGLWPSNETKLTARTLGRNLDLKPVMSWKTKIAQIKEVPAGSYVGYGCTYKTLKPSRLAVLPVGYYDGYDRGLSNTAFVLVRGKRAPIRGRVCMNMVMAEVTYIPDAALEDEVVLIGKQGDEEVSADMMAKWLGTISYEVTTSVNGRIERRVV